MSHFLRLSTEVRVMIYNYCLIVGKISPYLDKQLEEEKNQANATYLNSSTIDTSLHTNGKRRRPLPCLGLIQANRIIHTEAEPILFQRNKVILPNGPLAVEFFTKCLNTPARRLWLTDVELEFCASDMPASVKNSLIQAQPSFSQHHESLKHQIGHVIWPAKIAAIFDHTKLEKLTVKFYNSKCPLGCCHMDKKACAAFQAGFAHGIVKHISLHGLAFHNVDHFYDPDPESFKRGDREIGGMEMPIISDVDGEEDVDRDAIQMAEQIAR